VKVLSRNSVHDPSKWTIKKWSSYFKVNSYLSFHKRIQNFLIDWLVVIKPPPPTQLGKLKWSFVHWTIKLTYSKFSDNNLKRDCVH
jgi:hypothetical protein